MTYYFNLETSESLPQPDVTENNVAIEDVSGCLYFEDLEETSHQDVVEPELDNQQQVNLLCVFTSIMSRKVHVFSVTVMLC